MTCLLRSFSIYGEDFTLGHLSCPSIELKNEWMGSLPRDGKGLTSDQVANDEAEVDTLHHQLCASIFM